MVELEFDVRTEAEKNLGYETGDAEWAEAFKYALVKLGFIISREGDCNGERCSVEYLARLSAEIVRQNRFNEALLLISVGGIT